MRIALLVAAGCAFCLSQPGFATEQFAVSVQFSKPDVAYTEFQQDRKDCLDHAFHLEWVTTGSSGIGLGGSTAAIGRRTYSLSLFGRCMLAKGYQLDPKGFFAAKFWRFGTDKYQLIRT